MNDKKKRIELRDGKTTNRALAELEAVGVPKDSVRRAGILTSAIEYDPRYESTVRNAVAKVIKEQQEPKQENDQEREQAELHKELDGATR